MDVDKIVFKTVTQGQLDEINQNYGSVRLASEKQILQLTLNQAPRDDEALRKLILEDIQRVTGEEEIASTNAQYDTFALYTGVPVEELKKMDSILFGKLAGRLGDHVMEVAKRERQLSERLLNDDWPDDIMKRLTEHVRMVYSTDYKKK